MSVPFVTAAMLFSIHSWIFVEALRAMWTAYAEQRLFYSGTIILVIFHSAIILYMVALFIWHGWDVRRVLKERSKQSKL